MTHTKNISLILLLWYIMCMVKEDNYVKRPEEHILEDESRLLFKLRLPREWIKSCKTPDYGIDIEIQIVEGDRVTEKILQVQIKATNSNFDKFPIAYSKMETKNLKQYEASPLPILIIYFVKPHNAFYCIFAQEYIKEVLSKDKPDWREQKTVTIKFDEDSNLIDFRILDQNYQKWFYFVHRNNPMSTPELSLNWYDGIPQSENKELQKRIMDAHLYILERKFEDALETYEIILRELFLKPIEKMSILINLGNTYHLLHRNDEAMKNFKSTLEIAKKIEDINAKVGEAYALCGIGLIYQKDGNYDESLAYFEKSILLHNDTGNTLGKASVLGNIALSHKEKGKKISKSYKFQKNSEFDKALDYAKQMLDICITVEYKLGEALALIDIGVIYSTMEEWDEALKYYNQSLVMQREMNDKIGEALILGNIGADFYSQGELDDAMKYCKDSLRMYGELGNKQGEAFQLGKIGLILEAKKEFKEARNYLVAAIAILDEIGLKYGRDAFEQALKEIEGKA
jgi:tetratricopeptide (TPR) repeat protein